MLRHTAKAIIINVYNSFESLRMTAHKDRDLHNNVF